MRVAIMGSGGLGGLYGGRLAQAGCDVTFVARGAHLAALQEHGLLLESDAHGNVPLMSPPCQSTTFRGPRPRSE